MPTERKTRTFKPTYLYIKRHTVTGKLYFGKTTSGNVESYSGSGIEWTAHLKEHGKDKTETIWYCLYYDRETIKEFALNFSRQHNIVESAEWANRVPESGLGGGNIKGRISPLRGKKLPPHSDERKQINSLCHLGLKDTDETRAKKSKALLGNTRAKGRVMLPEELALRSDAMKGINKGRKLPTKGIPKKKEKCPHCGKEAPMANLKRWHFDHCKELCE